MPVTRPIALGVFLLTTLWFAPPATAAEPSEVKAEVPALAAFHDVIYPIWHQAWPSKDVGMLKELAPQVRDGVAAIAAAELPGILRDKHAAWTKGVAALQESAGAYQRAASLGETQALLDAAEALHARFEALVRVIRPPMKELDAYHQSLYPVVHRLMPAGDIAGVKAAAAELVARCEVLPNAALPKRAAVRESEIRAGFAALCAASRALAEAAAGSDVAKVQTALDTVHGQYQQVEKLFE